MIWEGASGREFVNEFFFLAGGAVIFFLHFAETNNCIFCDLGIVISSSDHDLSDNQEYVPIGRRVEVLYHILGLPVIPVY